MRFFPYELDQAYLLPPSTVRNIAGRGRGSAARRDKLVVATQTPPGEGRRGRVEQAARSSTPEVVVLSRKGRPFVPTIE